MENPPMFENGKPSISMGHLYHGELLNNQRVYFGCMIENLSIQFGILLGSFFELCTSNCQFWGQYRSESCMFLQWIQESPMLEWLDNIYLYQSVSKSIHVYICIMAIQVHVCMEKYNIYCSQLGSITQNTSLFPWFKVESHLNMSTFLHSM